MMNKLDSKDAKKIGEDIGIEWKKVNLDEFTKGVNIEFEHGTKFPETNVTNNDKNMTGKIAWAHLKEFPDYYTRLEKLEKTAREYWKGKVGNDNHGKNSGFITTFILIITSLTVSSCSAIGDIFKAGMSFGIFIVVAIIVVVIILVLRFGKNKNS